MSILFSRPPLFADSAQRIWHIAVLIALCTATTLTASAGTSAVDYRPNELLVSVVPDMDGPVEVRSLTAYGTVLRSVPALHMYCLRLNPSRSSADPVIAMAARLKRMPGVTSAEPNYLRHAFSVPNDSHYALQHAPQRVQADLAWNLWQPKQQIIIAVLDTGVDSSHPDLTNKILRDAYGVVGYDALVGRRDTALDTNSHGTHVAGIATAQINNGAGVAGIAGWNGQAGNSDSHFIKIMPVRVLGAGGGDDASIADGITWAVDHGARVINMSLGGTGTTDVLNAACQYAWQKGCVICAAAGNESVSTISYPAGYNNVIAVAATDSNDQLTDYTNFGSWVQVAAPGGAGSSTGQIYSTMPTYDTHAAGVTYTLNYDYSSGSSMAAPVVAGEAALIMAHNPSLTNTQVYNLILNNVDSYSTYLTRSIAVGAGRINVYKALLAAGAGPPAVAPPASSIFFQNAQSNQIALWAMNGQTVAGGQVVNYTPAPNWKLVAEADMNADGQTDLIFQNALSGRIAVWYMNSAIVIGSTLLPDSPGANWQVVGAGDFNADGQVDLIFQNAQTHEVAVWLLNGTTLLGGGLVNATPVTGWNVVGVTDITGTGRRDVVFQNTQSNQIAYWTLKGQTVTGASLFPDVPGASYKIVGMTDLNGDNNPDFVFQASQTGHLVVWYMNGVTFQGGGLTSITPAPGWGAAGPR